MATYSDTGPYSGHLRLRSQVDVGDPGPSTTSVTVRLRIWVGTDGWNFGDGQRVGFTGWKSGGRDFNNNLSSGEMLVIDESWSHPVGSSSVLHNFTGALSGNSATGSSPRTSVDWRVAARPGSPPGPPRALRVYDITSTGAKFDWSPPADNGGLSISHYEFHWRREVDSNYDTVDVGTSSRGLISLSRNTEYRWRVRAVNSAGGGDLTGGGTFRTDAEVPVVGLPVTVTDITAIKADINWAVADNGGRATEKSHVIVSKISDRANLSQRVHDAESAVTQTRTIFNLDRATRYYYWIRIFNGVYWSEFTQTRDFVTNSTTPASRPTLAVAANSPSSAIMAWSFTGDDGGSGITGYNWQVSEVSDFSSLFASGSTTTATSRTQSGLTPAGQYFFRVQAKNTHGPGPWSSIKSLIAPQGIKVWLGTAWSARPLYYWDGTEWAVPTSIKVWNGTSWIEAS